MIHVKSDAKVQISIIVLCNLILLVSIVTLKTQKLIIFDEKNIQKNAEIFA